MDVIEPTQMTTTCLEMVNQWSGMDTSIIHQTTEVGTNITRWEPCPETGLLISRSFRAKMRGWSGKKRGTLLALEKHVPHLVGNLIGQGWFTSRNLELSACAWQRSFSLSTSFDLDATCTSISAVGTFLAIIWLICPFLKKSTILSGT